MIRRSHRFASWISCFAAEEVALSHLGLRVVLSRTSLSSQGGDLCPVGRLDKPGTWSAASRVLQVPAADMQLMKCRHSVSLITLTLSHPLFCNPPLPQSERGFNSLYILAPLFCLTWDLPSGPSQWRCKVDSTDGKPTASCCPPHDHYFPPEYYRRLDEYGARMDLFQSRWKVSCH